MIDEVEQTGAPVQDPSQTAPAAPAAATPAPAQPAYTPPAAGPAPWSADLEQAFTDPQQRAQVDAYLRSNIQPRMTQYEQQLASTREAQQMYDAFREDPDAANIAVNRQLYGDEFADGLASSIGRYDQMSQQQPAATAPAQQYAQQAPAQPPAPAVPPEYQEMYNEWSEQKQQAEYDQAKANFLADPQYQDIDANLFDPFVSGASTWEEAVNSYRAYAAHFATRDQTNEPPAQPPPALGSQAQGTVGSTPAVPRESLDEAIDGLFSEQRQVAPPTLG